MSTTTVGGTSMDRYWLQPSPKAGESAQELVCFVCPCDDNVVSLWPSTAPLSAVLEAARAHDLLHEQHGIDIPRRVKKGAHRVG